MSEAVGSITAASAAILTVTVHLGAPGNVNFEKCKLGAECYRTTQVVRAYDNLSIHRHVITVCGFIGKDHFCVHYVRHFEW